MELPLIHAKGTPHEIGLQHGRQAQAAIKANIAYYCSFWNHYCGVEKSQVLNDAQVFLPFIEQADEELIEEMQGVAAGANLRFEEILALNARWELNYAYLFPRGNPAAGDGCTALALTPQAAQDGHLYIGQNWDYKPGLEQTCVLLRIEQRHKPDILLHTEAGIIGHKGFNSAGVGICMNFIRCDRDAFKPGLPVWLKVRSLLNADTLPKCLQILMQSVGPNSVNMLIGHRDGEVIDVECAPDDLYFLYPQDGILTHSNHFLAPQFCAKDTGKHLLPDTVIRSARARRLLAENKTDPPLKAIKAVLTDHFGHPDAICRHRDPAQDPYTQWETLASLIMDLSSGQMHYTSGPPCTRSYQQIALRPSG